jgi:inhibitor of KinA sporulation pathway (predicted exonuclease)
MMNFSPECCMARRLDQILVIDVESTCWEGEPPAGETSEIIEIGLCPVDVASAQRLEKRSILVRPQRSDISRFCTELTSLVPAMFTNAGSLADAVQILVREYGSRDRLWTSWGDYDRKQFERICRLEGAKYPFGPSHLNLKTLFSLVAKQPRELGLEQAYDLLGWTLQGRHHRGDDDAWNIAGILCMMLESSRSLL